LGDVLRVPLVMTCLSVMDSRLNGCWYTLHVRPRHRASHKR